MVRVGQIGEASIEVQAPSIEQRAQARNEFSAKQSR